MKNSEHVNEMKKMINDKMKWYSECIESIKKDCKNIGTEAVDNKIYALDCLLDLEIKITKIQMKINGCCKNNEECCEDNESSCCQDKENCC